MVINDLYFTVDLQQVLLAVDMFNANGKIVTQNLEVVSASAGSEGRCYLC